MSSIFVVFLLLVAAPVAIGLVARSAAGRSFAAVIVFVASLVLCNVHSGVTARGDLALMERDEASMAIWRSVVQSARKRLFWDELILLTGNAGLVLLVVRSSRRAG